MKFNLNQSDQDKLIELLNHHDFNLYMADLILDFTNSNQRYMKNVEAQNMQKEFLRRLHIDKEVKFLLKEYFPHGIKKLDDEPYKKNPYFKNIKIENVKFQDYTLGYETYKPNEVFIADDYKLSEDPYCIEMPTLGYFENTHKFIAIKQNKVIWMSITPAETDTMIDHINKMHGNIITFGLGLGYFQYMSALKDNVSTVTIVERDENIINLFKTHILPQFGEYAKKIIILHEDAYNCLDKLSNYDCVYVDLWHNPNDGVSFYIDFKHIEGQFPNAEFYYWLEDGIIALLRRCTCELIAEQFEEELDESCYTKSDDITDKIINNLYYLYKDKTFNTYEEIRSILEVKNLKQIAKKL